eukprot:scaffold6634_cov158-Amphora_coffeaeformis.AAC.26
MGGCKMQDVIIHHRQSSPSAPNWTFAPHLDSIMIMTSSLVLLVSSFLAVMTSPVHAFVPARPAAASLLHHGERMASNHHALASSSMELASAFEAIKGPVQSYVDICVVSTNLLSALLTRQTLALT